MRLSLQLLQLLTALWILPPALPAEPVDLEEEVRRIATELRCAVCQNLSVADSPSELAQQMREVILEQLKEGKSPEQIKAYFVSKYGEWILLAPPPKGFNLLIWVLPFGAVVAGILLVFLVGRHWVEKKSRLQPTTVNPALMERVKREVAAEGWFGAEVDREGEGPRTFLLQERARLYADLKELEFDYQAGRLSERDYQDLRQGLETRAAKVLKELESFAETLLNGQALAPKPARPQRVKTSFQGWRVAAGGIFLLLFGVTLGVLLTKSLRPRVSEGDTITGDFLTGTGPKGLGGASSVETGRSKTLASLLAQGRTTFERQEWPTAIEAFRKVLAIDPNQPEANTYMGLILSQAGHADGALLAFDQALASDPNFPLALWGKGLVLFHETKDYRSARMAWEKLLLMVPSGEERKNIQKLISDAKRLEGEGEAVSRNVEQQATHPPANTGRLSGTILLDSSVKDRRARDDTLFIIVRRAMGGEGPPMAVKKISSPSFPLKFSIGAEDAMIPGMPFGGKMAITVRLDKDGNPSTKSPGDLVGVYKKNPVEVGQSDLQLTIDRVL
jgi:cytochrome c-type biogenesis protein CcmH